PSRSPFNRNESRTQIKGNPESLKSRHALAHLHHAEEQLKSSGPALNLLRSLISIATDVLIWLSTWGDSSRMTHALKAAKQSQV
ncbi:hypothetical protein NKH55_30240, partial [Mesorhizobium opportunistum]